MSAGAAHTGAAPGAAGSGTGLCPALCPCVCVLCTTRLLLCLLSPGRAAGHGVCDERLSGAPLAAGGAAALPGAERCRGQQALAAGAALVLVVDVGGCRAAGAR